MQISRINLNVGLCGSETQPGENLVMNPESLSIPEEIVLDATSGYTIVRPSNQVADGEQLLSEAHLDELRTYLRIIHNKKNVQIQAKSPQGFHQNVVHYNMVGTHSKRIRSFNSSHNADNKVSENYKIQGYEGSVL